METRSTGLAPLNTIQSVLRAIIQLPQPPQLASELIAALSATYNSRADGVQLLEVQALNNSHDPSVLPVLLNLFKDIGLPDCASTMQRALAKTHYTPLIQSLQAYGYYDDARKVILNAPTRCCDERMD